MKMGALKWNGSYTSPCFWSPSRLHHTLLPSNSYFPIPTNSITLSPSLFPGHPARERAPTSRPFVRASPIPTGSVEEVLPAVLDSSSIPPPIFDGTTRLYICYKCPYAQRVWITRNCKGLQDKVELIPINLQNRPAWYKEKVNPANKVPSLEHNNEIKVESLDLIKYIDSSFEGPTLSPTDPSKEKFAQELFSYTDSFNRGVASSFKEDVLPLTALKLLLESLMTVHFCSDSSVWLI